MRILPQKQNVSEFGLGQVRSDQVWLGQVRLGQVRLGQVGLGGKAPPVKQTAQDEIHAVTVTYKYYTDLTRIMLVFWMKMKKWG